MRTKNNNKQRSDKPSGRQAAELPEHSDKVGSESGPAPESLHQGQGPDFVTQDSRMQKKNKAVKQMKSDKFPNARNPIHQPIDDEETPAKSEGLPTMKIDDE